MLINILSNAVKYNGSREPRIDIRTLGRGQRVHIDVVDYGGGVSREDVSMVFEKFSRGSDTGHSDGAGLGLPISRAIMRAMNSDLTVEFAPDKTSFFRLSLMRDGQNDAT